MFASGHCTGPNPVCQVLLSGGAEFEQHCVRERPDLVEVVINRFAEGVGLFDGILI